MSAPPIDHRIRVARERRERMRRHLLETIQEHFVRSDGQPARIEDIVRAAEVSRGTFYKYFNSLDEAAAELGAGLARQMVLDIETIHRLVSQPVERVAMGFSLFLYRAVCDQHWAAFMGHIQALNDDNLLLQDIASDLSAGKRVGQFQFDDLALATDFVLGVTLHGIRGIAQKQGNRTRVEASALLLLKAMGTDTAMAVQAISRTGELLRQHAPGQFPWWQPGL